MTQQKIIGNGKIWLPAIVLLPLLLFGLFYLYTKQARTDLQTMKYPRTMFPIGVDTIVEGTLKRIDTVYHEIPDFSFTNQYGQTVTQEQFPDKILVVDFFFTSCPTICPTMSEQLARVQNAFLRDDRIVIVSFSIDPTRDTPEKLKAYGEEYGAIPGKWQFLTGDKEEIYTLALDGFKMSALDEGGDLEHDGFVHTDRFALIDPNWNIRGYYKGTSESDVNVLLGDALLLLEEFKR